MSYQFPALGDAKVFELFCKDFFKYYRKAAEAQIYARQGQKQKGIDVLLTFSGSAATPEGVQCKKKGYYRGKLKLSAIDKIIADAKEFEPQISHLHIASTTKRDPSHQSHVENVQAPFKVTVYSWDDFNDEIIHYPLLIPRYFKQFVIQDSFQSSDFANDEIVRVLTKPNEVNSQIVDAIEESEIKKNFGPTTAAAVRRLLIEICKNALHPGEAQKIDLTISPLEIQVDYDGKDYNPYLLLKEKSGKGGKGEIEYFIQKYMSTLHLTHNFHDGINSVVITFPGEIKKIGSTLPLSLKVSKNEPMDPDPIQKIISETPHAKKIFLFLTDEAANRSDFTPFLDHVEQDLIERNIELNIFALEGNEDFLDAVKKSSNVKITYTLLKTFCK